MLVFEKMTILVGKLECCFLVYYTLGKNEKDGSKWSGRALSLNSDTL